MIFLASAVFIRSNQLVPSFLPKIINSNLSWCSNFGSLRIFSDMRKQFFGQAKAMKELFLTDIGFNCSPTLYFFSSVPFRGHCTASSWRTDCLLFTGVPLPTMLWQRHFVKNLCGLKSMRSSEQFELYLVTVLSVIYPAAILIRVKGGTVQVLLVW
jgi:hypothetical protein